MRARAVACALPWALPWAFGLAGCWSASQPEQDAHFAQPTGGLSGGAAGAAGWPDPLLAGTGAAAGAMTAPDDSYRVGVHADDTTLCPGDCTTIAAIVANGTAPIDYAWNQPELVGGGPFEVCPSESTTYEVVATDSFSTVEEFGGGDHQETNAARIVVTPDCNDPDVTVPIDVEPRHPTCELRIASGSNDWISPFNSWGGQGTFGVDAQGNAYFVSEFAGDIQVGDFAIGGPNITQGVVVKLSPACKPIWVKVLRADAGSLGLSSLVVSPTGNEIYVGAWLEGTVTLAGESFSTDRETGLLLKLNAHGAVDWAEPLLGSDLSLVGDLAITDNGDVIATGWGPGDLSFASLPNDVGGTEPLSFVARVQPNGLATFLHAMPYSPQGFSVAVLENGSLALVGSGVPRVQLALAGGLIEAPLDTQGLFVAVLDAQGAFLWGKTVRSSGTSGGMVEPTTMTPDRNGNVVLDTSRYEPQPDGSERGSAPELIKLSGAGDELWSRERPYVRRPEVSWSGGVAVDSGGNILVLDQIFDGAATEDGRTFATNGPTDLILDKRTADGDLIWLWQAGGPWNDWCWAVTTDAQDAIWVGSGQPTDEDFFSGEIVITRLAP